MPRQLRIALLCGGPSLERGISLNSARSVFDHLDDDMIEVIPIYFDVSKRAYEIPRTQIYCNTPSDFDFKLKEISTPLEKESLKKLLTSVDLVFPAIHGAFGEDGELQSMLERLNVPFIGPDSAACKRIFDKADANSFLERNGLPTIPTLLLTEEGLRNHPALIDAFIEQNSATDFVIKPASGGSSYGVERARTAAGVLRKAKRTFKKFGSRVVVQPFCNGKEFSVVVFQNRFGGAVAMLPTEVEKKGIFTTTKKYLPSTDTRHYCPPRLSAHVIKKIQKSAEQLFETMQLRDFSRFDGWSLDGGEVVFSDFNPISGMEQNSFFFEQASRIGLSHRDTLRFIVRNACHRHGLEFPERRKATNSRKTQVNVLFGGSTSERQVSLMSGTNVWLKLRRSRRYDPRPFLLATDHSVWELPYAFTLNHTVEEIQEACEQAEPLQSRIQQLRKSVLEKLQLLPGQATLENKLPRKMTLPEFIEESELVFIALHGGIGENGELQQMLRDKGVRYTGSGPDASRLCMDKHKTGRALWGLKAKGVETAKKLLVPLSAVTANGQNHQELWDRLTTKLCKKGSNKIVVKPRGDGCSTGVVTLSSANELERYLDAASKGSREIRGKFDNEYCIIQMPTTKLLEVMFEEYIKTDRPKITGTDLDWPRGSDWIEVTTGVLGKAGALRSFNPSLAVAEKNVLGVVEKFQGGTGINITPPPLNRVTEDAIRAAKEGTRIVAEALGISGYARIDAFMHVTSGRLVIIEANTNPGLTPSTVIFHQALAEKPPMSPTKFLESILDLA